MTKSVSLLDVSIAVGKVFNKGAEVRNQTIVLVVKQVSSDQFRELYQLAENAGLKVNLSLVSANRTDAVPSCKYYSGIKIFLYI